MAHITTKQRTIDAQIIELVTVCDEHKQKIWNEIDMQKVMAALFDAMLVDTTDKFDKLNKEAQATNRNVYGLELEVATCRQHFTFLETLMWKVKKGVITTPTSPIYVCVFQHDFISMGCLLTLDYI